MAEFSTGAVRDVGGKGRCDLLPHSALLRVARHMENSLESHGERNWERGIPMHSFLDSAMRHVFKYMDGMTDEDHLAAAATNLLMALWTEDHMPEMQDIPTRPEHDECLSYVAGVGGYASGEVTTGTGPDLFSMRTAPARNVLSEATGGISETSGTRSTAKRPGHGREGHGEAPVGS